MTSFGFIGVARKVPVPNLKFAAAFGFFGLQPQILVQNMLTWKVKKVSQMLLTQILCSIESMNSSTFFNSLSVNESHYFDFLKLYINCNMIVV